MTVENFGASVEALSGTRPFRVYTIDLHNGRRIEVDHPLALAYKNGVAVFIAPGNEPVIFDHQAVSNINAAPANTAAE